MTRFSALLCLLLCVTVVAATKLMPAAKRLDDRLVNGKCAVVTLLYDGDAGFVLGAATLGHSLRASHTRMTMVALVTENIDVTARQTLTEAGWRIHDAKAVSNPNPEYFSRLEYIFTKLQIYTLTDYERVVYLDADTLVNENVDELCSCNAYHCSVVRNTFFNSGVIVAIPSLTIYNDMMSKYATMHSYTGGDQGFLNNYFWNGEECPFFDPHQKLESLIATDVSHLRCYRLPGYYNGDVGVYVSRGDKWQFDPDEDRQQPKITHYTLSIFKPWSWPSYIIIKDNWNWYRVYYEHMKPSAAGFICHLSFICFVAGIATLLMRRVRVDWARRILGIFMMNKIGRSFLGHFQHLLVFLTAFFYSQLHFYDPTFSLVIFYWTYCILFEIYCVGMWEKYWETAVGTRVIFDVTASAVYKLLSWGSLGVLLLLVWSNAFTIFGRVAAAIIWLFCVPGVAHTVFYQILPLSAPNK